MSHRREESGAFRRRVAAIGRWSLIVIGATACTRSIAPPQTVAPRYEGPIQSRDIGEGRRIYAELCSACHDGRVNPRGYHWSAGQMRHQIREGNRLMPPLDDRLLSDAQVEAVLAYLRVMGSLEGELPPRPEPLVFARASQDQPDEEPLRASEAPSEDSLPDDDGESPQRAESDDPTESPALTEGNDTESSELAEGDVVDSEPTADGTPPAEVLDAENSAESEDEDADPTSARDAPAAAES